MNVLHRPMVVKGRFNRDVAPPEIYAASSARPLRGGQPHQRPLTKKKKGPSRGPWPDSVFDDGGGDGSGAQHSPLLTNLPALKAQPEGTAPNHGKMRLCLLVHRVG